MQLNLINLLDWLEQTGWDNADEARLREFVSEPNQAIKWIERLRGARAVIGRQQPLENLPNINLIARYLDKQLDSRQTKKFEEQALQDDLLLQDLLRSYFAVRAADSTQAVPIPAAIRQKCYLVNAKQEKAQTEAQPGERFSIDLPFVDRDSAVGMRNENLDGQDVSCSSSLINESTSKSAPDSEVAAAAQRDDNSSEREVDKAAQDVPQQESLDSPPTKPVPSEYSEAVIGPPSYASAQSPKNWWPAIILTALVAGIGAFLAGWFANGRPTAQQNNNQNVSDTSQQIDDSESNQNADSNNENQDGSGDVNLQNQADSNDSQNENSQNSADDSDTDDGSSTDGSSSDNSNGSDTEGSGTEGSGTEGSGAGGSGTEGSGTVPENLLPEMNDNNDSDAGVDDDDQANNDQNIGPDNADDQEPAMQQKLGEVVGEFISQNELLAYFGAEAAEALPGQPNNERVQVDFQDPQEQQGSGEREQAGPQPEQQPEQQSDQEGSATKPGLGEQDPQPDSEQEEDKPGDIVFPIQKNAASAKTEEWRFCVKGQPIRVGQKLQSLKGFMPEFQYDGHAKVKLIGPASVRVGERNEDLQRLEIEYGRVVVKSSGVQQQVVIQFGALVGTLELCEEFSEVAIHCHDYFVPGDELVPENARAVFQLLVLRGSADWSVEGNTYELKEFQGCSLSDEGELQVGSFRTEPNWLERDVRSLEAASADIAQGQMGRGEPVVRQLTKLLDDSRDEVRALALENLCQFGDYQFLMDFLDADRYQNYWGKILDAVRFSLQQNPEQQVALNDALGMTGNKQQLFSELIRGYTQAQLDKKMGAAEDSPTTADRLVEMLDDDRLAIRVLAIENLRRIMGATYLYRPNREARTRREKIRKWRSIKIKYVEAPAPELVMLKPLEENADANNG